MPNLFQRFQSGWRAFKNQNDQYERTTVNSEGGYFTVASSSRPDLIRAPNRGSERSIVNAISTRISMDVAAIKFEHVLTDINGRYVDTVDDSLNDW